MLTMFCSIAIVIKLQRVYRSSVFVHVVLSNCRIYTRELSEWNGMSSVLRPRQHSIGYMGDGFYRSKDLTNSIKVLKELS